VDRSKSTEEEAWNGRGSKFKSHQMGMQVPCSLDSEMPEENTVRSDQEGPGGSTARVGDTEGERDPGRAIDGGSRPHVDLDSTEVWGGAGGGIHEGKERHMDSEDDGAAEKFYGPEFLGEGVLRVDGGVGGENAARVHSSAGRGRSEVGADEAI